MMAAQERKLADNLATVRTQMAEAAQCSGRDSDSVTLVAVTKYVDTDTTQCLAQAGCHALGESRPQSLWQKAESLQHLPIQWHMIGHLQRNKIRRSLPVLSCIHSVDSLRLLAALQEEASRANHRVSVLLEINISRDVEKTGLLPEDALPLAPRLADWDALNICGLMAMSGRLSDRDTARRDFAQVRELRDRLQQECPSAISLHHLSMGMSRDFAIAIEEGATIVRVGSALFEGVDV